MPSPVMAGGSFLSRGDLYQENVFVSLEMLRLSMFIQLSRHPCCRC
jgi:hypothetical protein